MGAANALTAYECPLVHVSYFKYLGRILSELDDDFTDVVCNFRPARKKWVCLTWVLGIEGADARTTGMFYIAVVQVVLLYVSKTWVVSPHIGRTL